MGRDVSDEEHVGFERWREERDPRPCRVLVVGGVRGHRILPRWLVPGGARRGVEVEYQLLRAGRRPEWVPRAR